MGQSKVVPVGFRRYQVLTLTLTTEPIVAEFNRLLLAESVVVRNTGSQNAFVSMGNGDAVLVPAGTERFLPIKCKHVGAYTDNAGGTTVEIMGLQD